MQGGISILYSNTGCHYQRLKAETAFHLDVL